MLRLDQIMFRMNEYKILGHPIIWHFAHYLLFMGDCRKGEWSKYAQTSLISLYQK